MQIENGTVRKCILFDIDKTLVSSSTAHHDAFQSAIRTVFKVEPRGTKVSFHGMSDQWIAREVARARGLSEADIKEFMDACLAAIITGYEERVAQDTAELLPGVTALLDRLKNDNHILGLITGNLQPIAYAKLGKLGVAQYFPFGGFGSDAFMRSDMLAFAISRAKSEGFSGTNNDIWVLGDTPNDIVAAHANNVRCLAVATGFFSSEMLSEANADCIVQDLSDLQKVVKILYT